MLGYFDYHLGLGVVLIDVLRHFSVIEESLIPAHLHFDDVRHDTGIIAVALNWVRLMLFLRVGSNHPRMRQLIIVLIIKHE